MPPEFRLFPDQASSTAAEIDAVFFYVLAVCVAFTALIFISLIVFAVRYRRRTGREVPVQSRVPLWLEAVWMAIPLGLAMVMFVWGADVYVRATRAPADALDVFVVGRQWMWKLQHAEGPKEINELHVPLGRAIKVTLTSEDVIHSFYVPAFRIKMDALPGRYTSLWFRPTRAGIYHLFCAEYCGTGHSQMVGRIVVLEPRQYEIWLGGGLSGESLSASGHRLYQSLGCGTCHREGPQARGPQLEGLFGRRIRLSTGAFVTADENYLRESILDPAVKLVEGFEPIMPSYRGQISEEDLLKLIAFLKSMRP
jgi:cytochrome c oxidase subunit 2